VQLLGKLDCECHVLYGLKHAMHCWLSICDFLRLHDLQIYVDYERCCVQPQVELQCKSTTVMLTEDSLLLPPLKDVACKLATVRPRLSCCCAFCAKCTATVLKQVFLQFRYCSQTGLLAIHATGNRWASFKYIFYAP